MVCDVLIFETLERISIPENIKVSIIISNCDFFFLVRLNYSYVSRISYGFTFLFNFFGCNLDAMDSMQQMGLESLYAI